MRYLRDTSGISPTMSGQALTRVFPGGVGARAFSLVVATPAGTPIGTRRGVALTAVSSGDTSGTNNSATANVLVAYQLHVPLVRR